MSVSYKSLCDDFYVDMYVNTKFDLPSNRETLLGFFDRIRKQYPEMATLTRDNNAEYCLEHDRQAGRNFWASVDVDRVGSGVLNPLSFEEVFGLDKFVLSLVPYMLGINGLDVESLDLTFGLDFDFSGNHNEIIAEAFFSGSPFAEMFDLPGAGPVALSPTIITALDDDCSTRMRLSIDSKTDESEIRSKKYDKDKPVTLYLTVRQYPQVGKEFDIVESFEKQCRLIMELMDEKIVPNFVMPLTAAIAHRR
ncbi:MAG: hypothetical protein K8R02_00485 [Anaerohalosphaeraceae bacterium]|nr:hypothetical protein [Anaerohalosphaeraceae bacterium]